MYAKVTGSTVDKFPYTIRDLKSDNPNVSFTTATTLDDVAAYGVVQVTRNADPAYDPATEKLVEGTPVESAGSWSITRVVIPMTQEEQDAYADRVAKEEDTAAIKVDPQVTALLKARPAQINSYIDAQVTDMASAKEVLKVLARALAVVGHDTVR